MDGTVTKSAAIESFEKAKAAFSSALAAVPDEALDFIVDGEIYALGGLAYHVNAVLVHYRGTLEAIRANGFEGFTQADPPGLFETANTKAKAGLVAADREAVLSETDALHTDVRRIADGFSEEDFRRQAPVRFETASDPYPTSASDVLGWLAGHYDEHEPQVHQLLAAWRGTRNV